jgi:hypothetical protein
MLQTQQEYLRKQRFIKYIVWCPFCLCLHIICLLFCFLERPQCAKKMSVSVFVRGKFIISPIRMFVYQNISFFFIWSSVVYRFNDTLRLNVNKPLNSKSYLPYPLSPCSYVHSKHSHIDAFWYHHFTDYAVPVKALHIGGVHWRSNHVTNETF